MSHAPLYTIVLDTGNPSVLPSADPRLNPGPQQCVGGLTYRWRSKVHETFPLLLLQQVHGSLGTPNHHGPAPSKAHAIRKTIFVAIVLAYCNLVLLGDQWYSDSKG